MREVLTRETDFQFDTWMCLDCELNRNTKSGALESPVGPGVGTAGPLYSDSHLLGTVWDWGAVGQGGRDGLDQVSCG